MTVGDGGLAALVIEYGGDQAGGILESFHINPEKRGGSDPRFCGLVGIQGLEPEGLISDRLFDGFGID